MHDLIRSFVRSFVRCYSIDHFLETQCHRSCHACRRWRPELHRWLRTGYQLAGNCHFYQPQDRMVRRNPG